MKLRRIKQSIRWRLGFSVAAPELEGGSDESIAAFYNSRITGCEFLDDSEHYEYPRADWVLKQLNGKSLLEIGCGNGGMTRLIAPHVEKLTALDISAPSIQMVEDMSLPNVTTVVGLLENIEIDTKFDQIVMSEVIEHLRDPLTSITKAFTLLKNGGEFILTTPNGHWESDEHLHEFSLESFTQLLIATGCESLETSYLRDRDNRRRWLTAIVRKEKSKAEPDDFFDRRATAKSRRKT